MFPELTNHRNGEYLIPNLAAPDAPRIAAAERPLRSLILLFIRVMPEKQEKPPLSW